MRRRQRSGANSNFNQLDKLKFVTKLTTLLHEEKAHALVFN